ncbi:serine protease Do [Pedobacter sp. ok626]|uniref:trypsin-like peptidase domain-containing protein n=1 Tax=Pedobacter sp. ok626 TaxID=1761882 RepID=UPI0008911DFA|nr:trypsin-like peptidase domain-containing protein [Pedobacter sp. ok626]SDK65619.1 serine protease Do [Pedobacter sp. ok626]
MKKILVVLCFKLGILSLFCLFCTSGYSQSNPEVKHIETLIANCVEKAMATSVYMIEYDTLKNAVQDGIAEESGFTGVLVSEAGHILTASHAAMPNQVYQIRFPDGSRHIAVGLGRIGIQDKGMDFDMAMVKIIKPGKWPFALMAPAKELRINQPVISISYPGAFFKQMPNVRYGRISDIDLSDGFIESSAKMEPGDSGGPLFDELGRVVGVHSWIKEKEEQNYDVPADHFLKYWTALNTPKDYKEFPAVDDLPAPASSISMETVPALEEVAGISAEHHKSVVALTSALGTQQLYILGTVIDFSGANYIISKSSMVGNNPIVKMGNSIVPVQILKRDQDKDLVLLKAAEKLDGGIRLKSDTTNPELKETNLGKILISALAKESIKVGVLSATYVDMPLNTSRGYLGAGAAYEDGKITLVRIGKNSSVASLLKTKDQVIKINGVLVNTAADYDNEFAKYMAGDSISLDVIREGGPMQFNICLEGQPTVRHVSFEFPGGRSARSDGFKNVLIHDAAIKADECGSPVFDSAGKFYGINIARRSRTSSIVMPVEALVAFIKNNTN